jgi:ferrochelatase
MRYGKPSIASALSGLEDPLVVPLYPQYAESTTASVADVLPRGARMIESFHDHPAYIAALAASVEHHWRQHGRSDRLVMSFHGLPKRGSERYAGECRETARLLAERLKTEYLVTFQSRFGYAEWLQPYTQPTLIALARGGQRRLDVVFPGFVSDCLETLEEIGITARRAFLEAGGSELYLVSCLNESSDWISALAVIARGIEYTRDRGSASSAAGSARLKR